MHACFAALEEESLRNSMTELLAFTRRQGEHINALLARYETVRQFVMSVEGCALQVLRACGTQAQHLFTLPQPCQRTLPRAEVQFQETCTH